MGEFTTDHLAENRRRIPIIGQLSINSSVQFLGIPDFSRGSGLSFLPNLQAPTDPTGCVNGGTYNNNWEVRPGGPYSNTSVTWDTTVPACPDYMPMSLVNPRATTRRVRNDLLCCRCHGCMRIPSTSRNTIVNPRIHRRGDDREGPVTQ